MAKGVLDLVSKSQLRTPGDLRFEEAFTWHRGPTTCDRLIPQFTWEQHMDNRFKNYNEASDPLNSLVAYRDVVQTGHHSRVRYFGNSLHEPQRLNNIGIRNYEKAKKGMIDKEPRPNRLGKLKGIDLPLDMARRQAFVGMNLLKHVYLFKDDKRYKQLKHTVMLRIIHNDYPGVLLTDLELRKLQEALLQVIIDYKIPGCNVPKFCGTTMKLGWLKVYCTDDETADWLVQHFDKIKLWDGANLNLVSDSNYRPLLISGKFTDSLEYPQDKIINLIDAQNSGLRLLKWKIMERIEEGNDVIITFEVDFPSFQTLVNQNFKLMYRFGEMDFSVVRLKDNEELDSSGDEVDHDPNQSYESSDSDNDSDGSRSPVNIPYQDQPGCSKYFKDEDTFKDYEYEQPASSTSRHSPESYLSERNENGKRTRSPTNENSSKVSRVSDRPKRFESRYAIVPNSNYNTYREKSPDRKPKPWGLSQRNKSDGNESSRSRWIRRHKHVVYRNMARRGKPTKKGKKK